jgi:hypothetical protein
MANYIKCSQFLANNIYTMIDGQTLNKNCENIKFKKIISKKFKSKEENYTLKKDYTLKNPISEYRKFQYTDGLNTDKQNLTINSSCSGGLYFTTEDKIKNFMSYGSIIVDIEIPNNTKVFIEEDKIKAQDIIISKPKKWCEDTNFVLEVAKQDGYVLKYVKEQTPEICFEAVKQDGLALKFVKNQTPEICFEAVKNKGFALIFIKEQTTEICLEAVKQNGLALQYVKNETPEICLEAVKQNGLALQYVKNQTPEICLEAVKQNGKSLKFVKKQTEKICIKAVKNYPYAIQFVKEKTQKICDKAIKKNSGVKHLIERRDDY